LCAAALGGNRALADFLSYKYLRWFGNISYSYYLVHGFVVLILIQAMLRFLEAGDPNMLFWLFLVPVFAVSLMVGAMLFLLVEKPWSLRQNWRSGQQNGSAVSNPTPVKKLTGPIKRVVG
jgi:peptidoglycan/LPS O-acetylase OafA/YrhL